MLRQFREERFFPLRNFRFFLKTEYENYRTLASRTVDFVKIRKLGYYVTVVVTCGNSQSKTHQIAHIRHFEPQKQQYATTEVLDVSLRYTSSYSQHTKRQTDRQTDMFLFGVLYKESTLTTIPNS